jgi:hypothetical protein
LQIKFLFVLTFAVFTQVSVFAQSRQSDQLFASYHKLLNSSKVDTIIILKSGCKNCVVEYTNSPQTVDDGQIIYVLTQDKGQIKLAIFDDKKEPAYFTADSCMVFKYIDIVKPLLKLKEPYYINAIKEEKELKFVAPYLKQFPYEELTIQLPKFKYNFIIVDNNLDYMGIEQNHRNWFIETQTIITLIYGFSLSLHP